MESNIKIIDFGTSKFLNPSEKLSEVTGTAYYIAPEVISNNYDEKCDVWSCGIIMYMLLTGTVPFTGKTSKEILNKIKKNSVTYSSKIWKTLTKEANNFIQKILIKDPKNRISAEEALNEPWILMFKDQNQIELFDLSDTLSNLKEFHAHINFQRAALSFLSQRCITQDHENKLREIFREIDGKGDGLIDKDELIEAYIRMHGDKELAIRQANRIMKRLDINQNFSLDYNGSIIKNFYLLI